MLACLRVDFMLSLLNHQERVLVAVACLKLDLQTAESAADAVVQDPHSDMLESSSITRDAALQYVLSTFSTLWSAVRKLNCPSLDLPA